MGSAVGGLVGGIATLAGGGQDHVTGVDINKDDYYNTTKNEADRNQLQQQQNATLSRTGPVIGQTQLSPAQSMQAAQGQAVTGGQANLGNAALGQAARIGQMQQIAGPNLGNAAQVQGAQLGTQDEQFRQQQLNLANSLQNTLNGNGPSLAGLQLGQANAAAAAQRMSQAASQRGFGNTAATMRDLQYQQGAGVNANAIAAAQLGMQERLNAQNSLGNLLGTSRSQDIGAATSNAQLSQEANLANAGSTNQFTLQGAQLGQQAQLANQSALNNATLQQAAYQQAMNESNQGAQNQFGIANMGAQNQLALANLQAQNQMAGQNASAQNAANINNQNAANQFALQQGTMNMNTNQANQAAALQTMGLNDTQMRSLLGAQIGITNQEQANAQAYNNLNVSQNNALNAQNSQIDQNNAKATSDAVGGIGGGIAGMAMMSDEKQKKNISDGKDDVLDFLNQIGANKYDYKNPNMLGADDKTHYSPMAQELEKSKIGQSMVYNNGGTKMVDYGRGLGAFLSSLANVHERIKKLESK